MTLTNADVVGGAALLLILVVLPIWSIARRTRRLERMLSDLMNHTGLAGAALSGNHGSFKTLGDTAPKLPETSDAIRALAADPRRKIDAIKAYRQLHGVGLREAKEAVERLAQFR